MNHIIPGAVLAIGMISGVYAQELNTKNAQEVEKYKNEVSQNVAKIAAFVPIPEGVAVESSTRNIGNSSTTTRGIYLSQSLKSLPKANIYYGIGETTSSFNSHLVGAIENKTAMHPQIRFEMKF